MGENTKTTRSASISRRLSEQNREAEKTYKQAAKTPVSKVEKLHEELVGFTQSFQMMLHGNKEYDALYEAPNELLDYVRDGVILSELVSEISPSAIDMKQVHKSIKLENINQVGSKDIHLVNENLNIVIKAARNLGCKIVNTGAEDILGKKEHITLGLIWQIVRMHLVKDVNLLSHPELIRLLHETEQLTDLINLTPEQLLLRWLNHHLMRAGMEKRVKNFHTDLKDSTIYAVILERIAPRKIAKAQLDEAIASEDLGRRAVEIINQVTAIGCTTFVRPVNIMSGHTKFNIALVASMFNTHIGIHLPTESELDELFAKLESQSIEIAELKAKLHEALQKMQALGVKHAQLERDTDEHASNLQLTIARLKEEAVAAGVAHKTAQDSLVSAHKDECARLETKAQEVKQDLEAKLHAQATRAEKERLAKLAAMAGAEESAEAAEKLRAAEAEAKEAERLAKEEELAQKLHLQDRLDETITALRAMEAGLEEVNAELKKERAAKEAEVHAKEETMCKLESTKEELRGTEKSLATRRSVINDMDNDVDEIARMITGGLAGKVEVEEEAKGTTKLMKLVDQLLKCTKDNERKKHEALSKYASEQNKNSVILDKVNEQALLTASANLKAREDAQAEKDRKKLFFKSKKQ